MAKIQGHHVDYEEPEWKLDVQQSWHRVLSRIQHTKATSPFYMYLTNMVHSLVAEWNRVRRELDTGRDLRVKLKGPLAPKPKGKKERRRRNGKDKRQ